MTPGTGAGLRRLTQNAAVQDPIDDGFDAFSASYHARLEAEARMFESALYPQAPPDSALVKQMQVGRRREIYCLRTLLHFSKDAAERARQLTRRLPLRPREP